MRAGRAAISTGMSVRVEVRAGAKTGAGTKAEASGCSYSYSGL